MAGRLREHKIKYWKARLWDRFPSLKRKRPRYSGKEQTDSDFIIFHKGLMEIKEFLIRTSSDQLYYLFIIIIIIILILNHFPGTHAPRLSTFSRIPRFSSNSVNYVERATRVQFSDNC